MQIKALFDKDALDKNLRTGWGVSFLIDERILFDTGENGQWLIENMRILGVDIGKIEAVVISHDHWDHTGGLRELLARRTGLKVYACAHFNQEFKKKVKKAQGSLIEVDKVTEISKGIFTSGEVPGAYHGHYMPEQALFIKSNNGLTVVTGCAHPGIVKILMKAKERFSGDVLYLVFGGFHLMEADRRAVEITVERFKQMKVKKAGPTHCSGAVAQDLFKKAYGDDFVAVRAGEVLDI